MKLRKGTNFIFGFCFWRRCFVLTDTSRQNYLIHNRKIHCARIHSSILFFRYVTRKKEGVIKNDIGILYEFRFYIIGIKTSFLIDVWSCLNLNYKWFFKSNIFTNKSLLSTIHGEKELGQYLTGLWLYKKRTNSKNRMNKKSIIILYIYI